MRKSRKKSMKKREKKLFAALCFTSILAASAVTGCGSTSGTASPAASSSEAVSVSQEAETLSSGEASFETEVSAESPAESISEVEPEEIPAEDPLEGTYFSELTGEPVSLEIKNQRPIAAMIDHSLAAWPHYETAEGDVVYELMNSTLNERITRLMVLRKDYSDLQQMGSIRSARPTNIILAGEWNAVLCHDGGPDEYVDPYFAEDYAKEHFSGLFGRVDNGKSHEFTEYILAGELDQDFNDTGYSRDYNEFKPERDSHFIFTEYGTERDLTERTDASDCSGVALPFEHTHSQLKYNAETGTYDYYAYDQIHKDAEDGEVLTFKNVLIEECPITDYNDRGYMIYDLIQSGKPGWYLTDGHRIPITWTKESETGITKYYDADGNELEINRGKTYITLIPDESWEDLAFS